MHMSCAARKQLLAILLVRGSIYTPHMQRARVDAVYACFFTCDMMDGAAVPVVYAAAG